MRACRRCGVYGPPETGVCDGCGCDLREHAAELPTGRYRCAAVRIERTCRACGRRSPVDGLPADQVVRCSGCGASERVASGEWAQVLACIHAAADLVGEDPEGFERSEFAIDAVNPFAASARSAAGVTFGPDEAGALAGWLPDVWRVWAAPGLPIAPDTFEPYELRDEGQGTVRARSVRGSSARGAEDRSRRPEAEDRSGSRRPDAEDRSGFRRPEAEDRSGSALRYGLDPAWVRKHPGLVGAIADEHQLERAEPDVVGANGRWQCPSCGAAVSVGGSTRARCGRCRQLLHVPAAVRHAAQGDPRPDLWFVLFDGPSALRLQLERHPLAEIGAAAGGRRVTFPAAGGRSDDRPLGRMPVSRPRGLRRAARVLYLALVPLALVALAGALQRAPSLLDRLGW